MPTTIQQGFNELRSRTNITGLQGHTVAARQANVRTAVEKELLVLDSFLTGSYKRSTLIAPLKQADIDIVVVLDPSYFGSGARNVLERTRQALLKTYRTPKVSRNGQAVTITFDDFEVDVVPAFNRKGGGYLICNSGGNSWIPTNPKIHESKSSAANAAHNGSLVPIVKMLKAWNRQINRHFRSFHLEVLAWRVFDGVTISNDWSGVRYFFDKARATIPHKLPDPAGYDGDVSAYIRSTQQRIADAVSRLDTALGRAQKAEQLARAGRIADAYAEWRKIFGDYFPAYGP